MQLINMLDIEYTNKAFFFFFVESVISMFYIEHTNELINSLYFFTPLFPTIT